MTMTSTAGDDDYDDDGDDDDGDDDDDDGGGGDDGDDFTHDGVDKGVPSLASLNFWRHLDLWLQNNVWVSV